MSKTNANTCYVCKRIKESKDDFTKKRLKRLKRVKDIIKQMPLLRKTYTFFTTHKAYFIFLNITNKSIILFLILVSSSSKYTNNPPLVYIKYDVRGQP